MIGKEHKAIAANRRPRLLSRTCYLVFVGFAAILFVLFRSFVSKKCHENQHDDPLRKHQVNVPTLQPGREKLRVLFLTHKTKTYDAFMDRYFVFQYRTAKAHPFIDATMWGLSFEGYDDEQSLRANLVKRYGSVYFDVVFLFGIARNHELAAISHEAAIMIREHECWDLRCRPYLQWNNVSIGMFTFAQDMFQYQNESYRRLLVHSPTCAYTPYFYKGIPVQLEKKELRTIDVSLQGALTESVYPLRARFSKMANQGKLAGVFTRNHPGYDFAGQEGPLPDSSQEHFLDRQVREYAEVMKRSKICLMDASRYRYAYQKYAEAAAAGCLIVGDVPLERAIEFRKFVVEVKSTDSDEQIISTIRWWLDHDRERIERAAIGQRIVLSKYTWDNWVNDVFIESYNLWRQRQFGFWFPYPYALSCSATNVQQGNLTNSWCEHSFTGLSGVK